MLIGGCSLEHKYMGLGYVVRLRLLIVGWHRVSTVMYA